MKKKLPYGQSNYRNIIEGNQIYIDKTSFIEKLENFDSLYVFFLRPRRFGKSLFTSVLSNYYDINEIDDFDKLFGDTYIGKNPTSEKNKYYILKFNFSALITDSKESLEDTFKKSIMLSFDEFIYKYKLNIDYLKEGQVPSIFDDFLSKVRMASKTPLYVIIDEYDHFANEMLSFQIDLFSEIISKTGFVRKWYEVLKKGTESNIKRIFATGVSPITLDSLTSGFNIATDLTLNSEFNEMMGFTKAEVVELIEKTSLNPISNNDMDNLLDILQKNYNGYLFSLNSTIRLFNSDMILYYLQSYLKSGKSPDSLIDKNISTDYGKLGKLFDLKNKSQNLKVLDTILKGDKITCRITDGFSLEKDFSKDDFISLLFYLGFLTIDSSVLGRCIMKVPNYIIKAIYFNYFFKKVTEATDFQIDVAEIEDAIMDIAINGVNTNLITLVESTLNKLSNRDFIKFDEKYVKLIFLTYCFMSKIYIVKSEYEVDNGYIDIALLKQGNLEPNFFSIFELKYISKSQFESGGEKLIEEKANEAINQLKQYTQSKELSIIDYKLKKWALVFVNDKCVFNKEV